MACPAWIRMAKTASPTWIGQNSRASIWHPTMHVRNILVCGCILETKNYKGCTHHTVWVLQVVSYIVCLHKIHENDILYNIWIITEMKTRSAKSCMHIAGIPEICIVLINVWLKCGTLLNKCLKFIQFFFYSLKKKKKNWRLKIWFPFADTLSNLEQSGRKVYHFLFSCFCIRGLKLSVA
jgi:hypothetical protein